MTKTYRIGIVVDGKDNSKPAISQAKQGIKSVSIQLARLQKLVIGWKGFTSIVQGGRAFVTLAEDIQLSNNRLAISIGNMRKAAQAQKEIAALARETGGGYVALSQLYGRIAVQASAYNLQQKQVAQLTRATAKALQISGAGAAEAFLSVIFYHFYQAMIESEQYPIFLYKSLFR